MKYAVYCMSSGAIRRILSCSPDHLLVNLSNGEEAVRVSDLVTDATHWVDQGTLKERQDYTLTTLPLPCTITIEGVAYEVTEQPTFEFDLPGTYIIEVDAGPKYLKKEFEIDYQA